MAPKKGSKKASVPQTEWPARGILKETEHEFEVQFETTDDQGRFDEQYTMKRFCNSALINAWLQSRLERILNLDAAERESEDDGTFIFIMRASTMSAHADLSKLLRERDFLMEASMPLEEANQAPEKYVLVVPTGTTINSSFVRTRNMSLHLLLETGAVMQHALEAAIAASRGSVSTGRIRQPAVPLHEFLRNYRFSMVGLPDPPKGRMRLFVGTLFFIHRDDYFLPLSDSPRKSESSAHDTRVELVGIAIDIILAGCGEVWLSRDDSTGSGETQTQDQDEHMLQDQRAVAIHFNTVKPRSADPEVNERWGNFDIKVYHYKVIAHMIINGWTFDDALHLEQWRMDNSSSGEQNEDDDGDSDSDSDSDDDGHETNADLGQSEDSESDQGRDGISQDRNNQMGGDDEDDFARGPGAEQTSTQPNDNQGAVTGDTEQEQRNETSSAQNAPDVDEEMENASDIEERRPTSQDSNLNDIAFWDERRFR